VTSDTSRRSGVAYDAERASEGERTEFAGG
jgi:hypothetical protein